ncbi:MAG TPA: EF-hand domain-containing protein [Myxococcota bacterium]|nr:EF-hand domain-containing protein [Myxococcota bacterium]
MSHHVEVRSMRRILIAFGITALAAGSATAQQQGTPPTADPRAAFAATDKNKDGVIDHAEFQARITEVFYFADQDKNGLAKKGELHVFDEDELFAEADKNGDGQLSLREFVAARFVLFEEADTNKDGVLSLDEVLAEFEKH